MVNSANTHRQYAGTKEQCRALEEAAMSTYQISSLTMMERASLEVAKAVPEGVSRICVLAGTGKNGADGIASARILREWGRSCDVFLMPGSLCDEAKYQTNLLHAFSDENEKYQLIETGTSVDFDSYDVVIDAFFGIGLNREISGICKAVIEQLNQCENCYVIAVDLPSGVDATSGKLLGTAVLANKTITFTCAKCGMLLYPARNYCGDIQVVSIGFPLTQSAKDTFWFYYNDEVRDYLPPRDPGSNKGTYGRIACIAGSEQMPGAATLCCLTAYRSGAGIVTLYSSEEVLSVLRTTVPEVIGIALGEELPKTLEDYKAVIIGPGLGTAAKARKLVRQVLSLDVLKVLDADALNLLSQMLDERTKDRKERIRLLSNLLDKNSILTPHKKELSRLLGIPMQELEEHFHEIVLELGELGCTIVCKDAATVVVTGKQVYVNTSGNNGMSTGGSGDVLAGICGAFGAVIEPMEAACSAVYLHGKAGDLAKQRKSEYGMLASDIIDAMTDLMRL